MFINGNLINKILLVFVLFLASTSSVNAFKVSDLSSISTFQVESKLFVEPVEFRVTLPQSYNTSAEKRYVLILDFHPRSQPYLSGLHDWLSHNGERPWLETLIVTPSSNSNLWSVIDTINSKEGGSALLDFIEHDVLAKIDKNYRTNSFRIMNGFTYNASLSLYTLFHRPKLFNAYIAVSPHLSGNYANLLTEAEEKLKQLSDKPRQLFLSTGSKDSDTFNTLSETIKSSAPKQLEVQIKQYNDYSYMSQPILALVDAIEDLFSDVHNDLKTNSEISRKGAQAILEYYNYLSEEKYGFNVSAEGSLIGLGFSLSNNDPKKALSILKTVVETYPDSAKAYHSLAKFYAEKEQFEKAVEYQTMANQRSQNLIRWYREKYAKYLEEYQAALDDNKK